MECVTHKMFCGTIVDSSQRVCQSCYPDRKVFYSICNHKRRSRFSMVKYFFRNCFLFYFLRLTCMTITIRIWNCKCQSRRNAYRSLRNILGQLRVLYYRYIVNCVAAHLIYNLSLACKTALMEIIMSTNITNCVHLFLTYLCNTTAIYMYRR